MRHRKTKTTLDRPIGPRKALLRNLAVSLVLFERVTTTLAKAKAVRVLVEPLITLAKVGTLASRRQIQARLSHARTATKLMEVFGPRYQSRSGGYTRITKIGERAGDKGVMALIEFV